MMVEELRLIDPDELREMWGISVATYHRLAKIEGGLPPRVKIGSRYKFMCLDVQKWSESRRIGIGIGKEEV